MLFLIFAKYSMCEAHMKINYIPFEVQTYVPVTIKDIENRAFYKFEVAENSELSIKLINILHNDNPGTFDYKMVRLKVQKGNKIYYVDSKGNIKVSMKITKGKKEDMEKVINEMIAKYGIRRQKLGE